MAKAQNAAATPEALAEQAPVAPAAPAHADLLPAYPDTFPQESVVLMINYLEGVAVPTACLVHAGWLVIGFGLQTVMPDVDGDEPCPPCDLSGLKGCPPLPKEKLLAALLGLQKEGKTAAPFDWKAIMATIMAIIMQLLNP